ncbi:hypothetical protein [Arenibacter certesii]|nr:hypothetical protein [Arenibacter certesii]
MQKLSLIYKYGRNKEEIQENIKVDPFSNRTISKDILLRLENQLSFTYGHIESFNKNSTKTNN